MGLWLHERNLVLASGSKARRDILENAGISLICKPACVEERVAEASIPGDKARGKSVSIRLALCKAVKVSLCFRDHYVVGADQTLVVDGIVLSKPATRKHAVMQLRRLSGKKHILFSSAVVVRNGNVEWRATGAARMSVRRLDERFIESYLDSAGSAVLECVGAYQIEGLGVHLFDEIDGDQSVIMGIPLLGLLEFFRERQLTST